MLDSLCKCIDMMGNNCFSSEQYESLVQLLKDSIITYAEKAKERIEKRNEEEIDEEIEDGLLGDADAEEHILSKVTVTNKQTNKQTVINNSPDSFR